jgi:hypothetical protein
MPIKKSTESGIVMHMYYPSTWDTEAEGQPELHSKTLTHKTKQKALIVI